MKFKKITGVVLHTLIIFACLILFSWPYLTRWNLWVFLTLIALTHFVQDWAKIKFTRQSKHSLFFFVLDQVLHVSLLATLFLTDLKNGQPPLNNNNNALIALYNSDFVCLYITAIIVSSYIGYFIILIFKRDYLKKENPDNSFERKYGFIERFSITSALLVEGLSPLLIPLILAVRPLLSRTMKEKLGLSSQFASWTEILLSGAFSILTGLIFYTFI